MLLAAALLAPVRAQGLAQLLPAAAPAGQGRLHFWGLPIYDARLWVAPGFRQSEFTRHGFALELTYLREFSGADIARRSVSEMRRAGDFAPSQAAAWEGALRGLLPDVGPRDRITGIHRPGRGALFLVNGKPAGEIADSRFAALFFSIWLGPKSSEPGLRESLLEGTAP